jgi:hypothetical protein
MLENTRNIRTFRKTNGAIHKRGESSDEIELINLDLSEKNYAHPAGRKRSFPLNTR